MNRALVLLMVAPAIALAPAHAQTGGIQVAPVMMVLRGDDNIASLRLRNGRDRAVAFEIDVYTWRQENGEDVHITPFQHHLQPVVTCTRILSICSQLAQFLNGSQ